MFFSCASVILCLLLFECTARFFIKPSPECYGILFNNIELPPFTLKMGNRFFVGNDLPWRRSYSLGARSPMGRELPPFAPKMVNRFHADDGHPTDYVIVDGKRITKGDIFGIMAEDPVLSYTPKENAISHNGWWRSNNLGARSPTDMAKSIPLGKQRVIVFGESFTDCAGVPEGETWPFFLNNKSKNVEFFNFGVGGYSMGQCLLRYETIRNKADYDIAMLVFVPSADLWRDINVLRQLQGWQNYPLMPRFIVEDNQLKLIKSPYKTYDEFQRENKDRLSAPLKEYLRAYDRLYFSLEYESPPFWGESIFYKLLARAVYVHQSKSLWRNMMDAKIRGDGGCFKDIREDE